MVLRKKNTRQLIILALSLLGIGVAVYLIQFTQIFRPQAAVDPHTVGHATDAIVTFSLKPPVVSCVENKPKVTLEWTGVTDGFLSTDQTIITYFDPGFNGGTSDFNYEVFFREQNGPETRVGSAKYNLIYTLSTLDGLQPGHKYGFLVSARSPRFGPVYGSQGWSDGIYGWLTIPDCSGPFVTTSPRWTIDLDGNGVINALDFNSFVGDFKNKNLSVDFIQDQVINILDFNEYVRLFRGW